MAFQRTLGTLRSNDADGNEKVKKNNRFNKQNNNFASLVVALLRAQATKPITWLKNTTGNEHQGKRTLLVHRFLFLFDQR